MQPVFLWILYVGYIIAGLLVMKAAESMVNSMPKWKSRVKDREFWYASFALVAWPYLVWKFVRKLRSVSY